MITMILKSQHKETLIKEIPMAIKYSINKYQDSLKQELNSEEARSINPCESQKMYDFVEKAIKTAVELEKKIRRKSQKNKK